MCIRDRLQKGLQELGEEGAIQVFENLATGALLLGAVGTLQFEVVAQRLQTESKVDAIFEAADIPVSYTHLDVYKRQAKGSGSACVLGVIVSRRFGARG